MPDTNRARVAETRAGDDVWIPTACDMCYNSCTLRVHRVGGVVVKVEGIPEAPPNYGKICAKGNAAIMSLYNRHRITTPLRRRNPEKGKRVDPDWEPVTWDEAMSIMEQELRRVLLDDPRKLILSSFDVKSVGPVRAFMAAVGSPNYTTASAGYFCGNAVHPPAYAFSGSFHMHPDFKYANLVIMFGATFGFVTNHSAMPMATKLAEARRHGMKLVVVDPYMSNAAAQADEWLPIRPGTDGALALAMMHVLVHEMDLYDAEFLSRFTNAPYLIGTDGHYVRHAGTEKPLVWDASAQKAREYDDAAGRKVALTGTFSVGDATVRPAFAALIERLRQLSPEWAEPITTVPAAKIRDLARQFGAAAQIGSTITIDGVTLPHRPVSAVAYRGATAHKHGMLHGLAVPILNALVGAIDVPGGLINNNSAGPFGFPFAGGDGMLTIGNSYDMWRSPYPLQPARPPETAELIELFPAAYGTRAMVWLGILDREKFKLPYQPDTLIVARSNLMATSADPEIMAAALKRMRFIGAFADHHNETTELADLILPDTHFLERLVPFVLDGFTHATSAPLPGGEWGFNLQRPVVAPEGQSRHWVAVLYELAGRLGLTRELYAAFNAALRLEGEHRLDTEHTYTWEQLCDRWMLARLGPGGLQSMKTKGYYVSGRRTPAESYPRIFHQGRIPIYYEHYIRAGEEVKAVTTALGIHDWDVSDYQPIVEWKPCPNFDCHQHPEHDLFGVNHKLPFMTFSFTAENQWLVGLSEHNGKVFAVGLNVETARRKGLKAGDRVWLETPEGLRTQGVLYTTEGLHPECVSIPGVLGRWATANPRARDRGVHFNSLIRHHFDRLDTVSAALDSCVRLKVTKA